MNPSPDSPDAEKDLMTEESSDDSSDVPKNSNDNLNNEREPNPKKPHRSDCSSSEDSENLDLYSERRNSIKDVNSVTSSVRELDSTNLINPRNPTSSQENPIKESMSSPEESIPCNVFTLAIVMIIIAALFGYSYYDKNIKLHTDIKTLIENISMKYSTQKDIVWEYLQVGIERLINEEKEPAVFFMTQWSEESDTAYRIAMDTGSAVIKTLSVEAMPIILTSAELNSLHHGDIIEMYKEELQNRHVLIVKDIEKVSPDVAQDFRYFCDEINPLVGKAAIFFIMNMEYCKNTTMKDLNDGVKNALIAAEKCLIDIWGNQGGQDLAILKPVLSRIINQVLPIETEKVL